VWHSCFIFGRFRITVLAWRPAVLTWGYSWFSSRKCQGVTSNWPLPFPSTSFPIHYPLTILTFNSIQSQLLTVLLNKPWMLIKSSVFWDTMLCSLLKSTNILEGHVTFISQGWKISQARNQLEAGSKLCSCWFPAWLIVWSWKWRQRVSLKCWLTFSGLHIVISKQIELFITTAVRTSNPINVNWSFF
jgi:hypothetical protein